jgi:hypothetical protein
MGFRPASIGRYDLSPRWYVLFEDGQVFEDLPRTGMAGFDRNASKADPNERNYWGAWRYQDGAGAITRPSSNYPEKLKLEPNGILAIDSDRFSRCASVDGLRLDGAWTTYSNPNDPVINGQPAGQRPVLHFTREGRFVDEGVFASYLTSMGGDPKAGSGTYEIRDFTLTLRYSDGRVKRAAFTGLLGADAAAKNDVLFIGRGQFNKRK